MTSAARLLVDRHVVVVARSRELTLHHVLGNANHSEARHRVRAHVEALADGVLLRPQHLRHALADYGDAWCTGAIVDSESASSENPRSHRAEIVRRGCLKREVSKIFDRIDAR